MKAPKKLLAGGALAITSTVGLAVVPPAPAVSASSGCVMIASSQYTSGKCATLAEGEAVQVSHSCAVGTTTFRQYGTFRIVPGGRSVAGPCSSGDIVWRKLKVCLPGIANCRTIISR